MKKVVFVLKGDPFSWKCHESLRMGMAMGVSCEVGFIFIKDGVYALTNWKADELGIEGMDRLLENLEHVNLTAYVEDASLEERGIKPEELVIKANVVSFEDIKSILSRASAVFVW
ncbi:MAG: DsrE family protein [Aquificaceae bacterium]|nr:DsrE family protein [Aquificaceae bacterium]